ncbi:MAG: MerR family transcriptional regulator [Acidimicrobiia bacterium]|nr:MerR family transcriptional regulator [Acidimicrobiia bacterium]
MADSHLSIGEVLSLLQDEFPDVTISKIRFLESQGLIDPERTPSGYRKFYEGDIDRLRWILVQQRENFLPLKVIKDRLESAADGVPDDEEPTVGAVAVSSTVGQEVGGVASDPLWASQPDESHGAQPIWMADVAASRARPEPPAGVTAPAATSVAEPLRTHAARLVASASEVSLTAVELSVAAGITIESLRELERYGLVVGRDFGDDTYYDGDALLITTKSAAFLGHGIGARHLRMFKVAAEREAGFLEQVAMPLLKQRNPEARRQAVELVEELTDLGHDLRAALLRANLRQHLDRG